MKIAIPIADGMLCMHFGHCEKFALLDIDPAGGSVINQVELDPPPHEPGLLPKWLGEQGAELVIAGGMGQRAVMIFESQGIKVVTGAPALAPEEVVRQYLAGTLAVGTNYCDH